MFKLTSNTLSTSRYLQQKAIDEWVDWSAFSCPFFVTLTFKQCQQIEPGVWEHLNRQVAREEVGYLLKRISREFYGNAVSRHGRRVNSFAVAEKPASERLHYHLIADCPRPEQQADFPNLIQALWKCSKWADKQTDIKPADQGALTYLTKLRTKPGYLDAFDWHNTHLPT